MYIPLIVGIFAFIALILLLILDRRKDLNAKGVAYISRLGLSSGASERLFLTLKGFLLITALAFILGAILYYF